MVTTKFKNISICGFILFFMYLFCIYIFRINIMEGIDILTDNVLATNDTAISIMRVDGSIQPLGTGCVNIWNNQSLVFYVSDKGERACLLAKPDEVKQIEVEPLDRTTRSYAKNKLVRMMLIITVYIGGSMLFLTIMIILSRWKRDYDFLKNYFSKN